MATWQLSVLLPDKEPQNTFLRSIFKRKKRKTFWLFSHYLISRPTTITSFPLLTFGHCPNWHGNTDDLYRFTRGINPCSNDCSQTCSVVLCMTLISSLLFAGHLFFLLCLNSQIWSGDQLRKTNSFVMSLLAIILSQRSVCSWGFHSTDFSFTWRTDNKGRPKFHHYNVIITHIPLFMAQ